METEWAANLVVPLLGLTSSRFPPLAQGVSTLICPFEVGFTRLDLPMLQATHYAVEAIQDEARRLVCAGTVRPSSCISQLQSFFPAREWQSIEEELMICDFQLTDPVADLMGCQEWSED